MDRLLLTGFTPFDGREVNGSWIAATSYEAADHLEIPVVWGQPRPHLEAAIERLKPKTVISMGEGQPGAFAIECRARNERKQREDNLKQLPVSEILPGGPGEYLASIDTGALLDALVAKHFTIRLSDDAGQYICEETLYSLESLKLAHDFVQQVVFIHLPPFGTKVEYRGEMRQVDQPLLKEFVKCLVQAVKNLNLAPMTSHRSKNSG